MGNTGTRSPVLQEALGNLALRPIRLVSRFPIFVLLSGTMIASSARGQPTSGVIPGLYDGRLQCIDKPDFQHETPFKLSLTATVDDNMAGTITFDAQDDSGTRAVTYSVSARGSAESAGGARRGGGWVVVSPAKWETPAPARHLIMTPSGALDVNSWFGLNARHDGLDTISGIETGIVTNMPCNFSAKRVKAESTNIDPRVTPQEAGTGGPAPAAHDNARFYYCYSMFGPNGGENLAFSAIFEVPFNRDASGARDDFAKFVREKYASKDASAGCSETISRAEAEGDKARDVSNMKRKKIIETGWKPTNLPPRVLRGP